MAGAPLATIGSTFLVIPSRAGVPETLLVQLRPRIRRLGSNCSSSYKQLEHNAGVTEIVEIPDRGHQLVIDRAWREVAETALRFINRAA